MSTVFLVRKEITFTAARTIAHIDIAPDILFSLFSLMNDFFSAFPQWPHPWFVKGAGRSRSFHLAMAHVANV
jgi:hypothetical protein